MSTGPSFCGVTGLLRARGRRRGEAASRDGGDGTESPGALGGGLGGDAGVSLSLGAGDAWRIAGSRLSAALVLQAFFLAPALRSDIP